jgi:hypothetical protein
LQNLGFPKFNSSKQACKMASLAVTCIDMYRVEWSIVDQLRTIVLQYCTPSAMIKTWFYSKTPKITPKGIFSTFQIKIILQLSLSEPSSFIQRMQKKWISMIVTGKSHCPFLASVGENP